MEIQNILCTQLRKDPARRLRVFHKSALNIIHDWNHHLYGMIIILFIAVLWALLLSSLGNNGVLLQAPVSLMLFPLLKFSK